MPPSVTLHYSFNSSVSTSDFAQRLKHFSRYTLLQKTDFWRLRKKLPKFIDHQYPDYVVNKVYLDKERIYLPTKEEFLKDPDSFQKYLPIRETDVCKLIGSLPWRMNMMPQSSWIEDHNILEYKKANTSHSIPSGEDFVMVSGGWATNKINLERMATPRCPEFSYKEFLKAIQKNKELPVISLQTPPALKIFSLSVNPKAYAGVVTSKVIAANKKDAYSLATPIAYRVLLNILKYGKGSWIFDQSLYAVGGREKRNTLSKGLPPESRLVLMPEFVPSQICQLYAQPITEALSLAEDSPFFIGKSHFRNGTSLLAKKFRKCAVVLEVDWERFDADVTEQEIVSAFAIMRSFYPDSDDLDRVFIFMLSGFLYKNVVTPEGLIYKVMKGIPSGSPFTSLVGSIVNWLRWTTFIEEYSPWSQFKKHIEIAICGDDVLLGLPMMCPIPEGFSEMIEQKTGGSAKIEIEKAGFYRSVDPEFVPTFLKYGYMYGLPVRRSEDL